MVWKKSKKYLSPLHAIAFTMVLCAIFLILMHNQGDVEGWDVVAAFGLLFIAGIIAIIAQLTMLIKNKIIWWSIQILLSIAVVYTIIK